MSQERDKLADLIASVNMDETSGNLLRVHPNGVTPVFESDQRTADALIARGYRRFTEDVLLDRVAKAIFASQGQYMESWADLETYVKERFRKDARAALEAMGG